MRPFLRSLPAIAGGAFVFLAMLAIGFVPLFDGPGYESSLAAGLVLAFASPIVTALEVVVAPGDRPFWRGTRPEVTRIPEPFDAFCRGIANGATLAGIAFVAVLIHGARTGFCDLGGGAAHFALGPLMGALVGGAWGSLAGEIARGRRRRLSRVAMAVLLAAAGPLGSILVSVIRFYTSPMVFAYDPFVGYFSGTIYDTIIDFSGLVTYRAGSAATLLAAFIVALHLSHDENGKLTYQSIGRPGMIVLGAIALAGSISGIALGSKLGHWQTPETIQNELGALVRGDRCDVVYPRTMRVVDAQRFARDCDAHVEAGEKFFEVKGPPRIKAFLFADSAQKGSLMGASDTFIAKPWRREIYVQAQGYPHPVLGHELMHVIAGTFGRGPFAIAGSAGGLVPNPGLVEGVAVAAEPPEGDLSPRDWAKAMKDLNMLPPLERLFAVGFLAESSQTAYTVSGAFVGYVKDRFGVAAVRAWYGGADLTSATGKSLADLEADFRADLDRVALPEAARAAAKARFDRPAVFARRCPHTIDACKDRAGRLQASGDETRAEELYRRILDLDRGDAGARIAIAIGELRAGRLDDGKRDLQAIADDEKLPRGSRDRALELLADQLLAAGDDAGALARYAEIRTRTIDEDQLRTLDVKAYGATDARAKDALVALLIGARGRPPDRIAAVELLAAWAALAPRDGLPLYLLARQEVLGGELEKGGARLDRALGLPGASAAAGGPFGLARVQVEAERLRLVAACGLGDIEPAKKAFLLYSSHSEVSEARRGAARALLERCTRKPAEAR